MADPARGLLWAVGLGAAIVAGDQVTLLAAAALRAAPGDPVWRFQFATLIVGRQVPLLAALLLLGWIGWAAEARRMVRTAVVAGWALAVALGLAVVVLWADGPATRSGMLADQLRPFMVQWIRVLAVGVAGMGSVAVISLGLGRTLK